MKCEHCSQLLIRCGCFAYGGAEHWVSLEPIDKPITQRSSRCEDNLAMHRPTYTEVGEP